MKLQCPKGTRNNKEQNQENPTNTLTRKSKATSTMKIVESYILHTTKRPKAKNKGGPSILRRGKDEDVIGKNYDVPRADSFGAVCTESQSPREEVPDAKFDSFKLLTASNTKLNKEKCFLDAQLEKIAKSLLNAEEELKVLRMENQQLKRHIIENKSTTQPLTSIRNNAMSLDQMAAKLQTQANIIKGFQRKVRSAESSKPKSVPGTFSNDVAKSMEMLLKLDLLAKEEDEEQREQENSHSIESKSDDIGQNNNAKKAIKQKSGALLSVSYYSC